MFLFLLSLCYKSGWLFANLLITVKAIFSTDFERQNLINR